MKKLLTFLFLFSVNVSYAGESFFSPKLGMGKFDRTFLLINNSNLNIENNLLDLGIGYRYRFDNGIGIDASYSQASGDFVAVDQSYTGEIEVVNFTLSANILLIQNSSFQPYLGIGSVYNEYNFSTNSGSGGPNRTFDSIELLFRAGLDYQINNKFNIGAEFSYYEFDFSDLVNDDFFEGDYRKFIFSVGYRL